ncbi:MAG: hypothetical protein CL916_12440 [Deltaproteobacteria bacterium]|nr:hypothetical protein [Deltaproteobacteria bacterium]
MFLFLLACSDYSLHQKSEKESAPVMEPEDVVEEEPYIVVDPMAVSFTGICGDSESAELMILNAGEGELVIHDIEVQASGWSIQEPVYPLILATGETYFLEVIGESGSGILSIYSNDPQTPGLWVELQATKDMPPALHIQNPQDGMIIPVEGASFVAQVSDLEDELSQMVVSWFSNIDGLLDTTVIDEHGNSVLEGILPSHGAQEITAMVFDSCGNEGLDVVGVCQQFGYETENLDISTWNFEGSAQWDNSLGVVELTNTSTNVAGTAFSTASIVNAEQVEIDFMFYVSGGSGADGFSLTALDVDRMTGFVGSTGGGIGYAGMPGWSIEVDTYYNSNDPTSTDHVAFTFDGAVGNPVIWAPLPEMEDGQWHTMRVEVNAPHVLVEIDGVVYLDQNITGNLNFPAYIGFTAATGSLTNYHRIDALTVTEQVCSEE